MKTITATVTQQNLVITASVLSVALSVNNYALRITYDEEWSDCDKIVTFRGADGRAIAIQDNGEEAGVTIPWEVLRCPGKVYVGVVGYKGTVQKLATTGLYDRNTFIVLPESFGLQEAMTPTPDVYQKLLQVIDQFNNNLEETQEAIGDIANLDTEHKDNLVAAINELVQGGSSGTVKSVNNIEPDSEGNVALRPENIGAQQDITINGTTLQL